MKSKEELERIQRRIEAAQRAYTYSDKSDTRSREKSVNPYKNLQKNTVSTGTGAARAYAKEKEQADENTRRLLNGVSEKKQADENTTRLLSERRREKSAASKAYAKETTDRNTLKLLTGWEAGRQAARNTKNLKEGRREAAQADDNTERLLAESGDINYYDDFLEVYNGKKDLSQYNEKQKKKITRLSELMDEQRALRQEQNLPMYQGRRTNSEIQTRLNEIAKEAEGIASYERTAEDYGKNFMAGVEATGKGIGDFFANLWGGYSELVNTGAAKVARAIGGGESELADTLEKGIDEQRAARTETNEKWNRGIQERYGLTEAQAKMNEGVQSFAGMLPSVALGMLTGGAGAAGGIASGGTSVLANNTGLIGMAASAAGRASAEAQAQGATRDQATLYGIGSGALEGMTEAIFNGIPGLSGVMSGDAMKKLVKNEAVQGVIGWAADTLGEGAEEVISAAIDPYLKRATYDPNAANATADELIEAFKGGAIQSAIMGMAHTAGGRIAGAMTKDNGYTGNIGWSEASPEMSETNRQAARNREDATRLVEIGENGGTGMDVLMDAGARRAVLNRENAELLLDMSGGDAERAKELVRTAKQIERTKTVKEDKGAAIRQLTEIRRAQDAGSMMADEAEALRRIVLNTKMELIIDENLPEGVNGKVSGNKIYYNPNGQLDAATLAVHEFAHVAENAKGYRKLAQAAKEAFLTSFDGDGNEITRTEEDWKAAVEEKYAQYTEAGMGDFTMKDAEAEVIAEKAQELLGMDEKTITRMTQRRPNAVRRVVQAIDDMIHYFKGTAQERQLIEVRRRYVKAVTEGLKNTEATKEAASRYSLMEFEDGKKFVNVDMDQKQFDGLDVKEMRKKARQIIKKKFAGKVIGITNKAFVNGTTADEYTALTAKARKAGETGIKAKLRASAELDNLLEAGTNFRTEPDGKDGHVHPKSTGDFQYFDTIFKVGNKYYQGTINIMPIKNGLLLKDVTQIKDATQVVSDSYGKIPKFRYLSDTSINTIPQTEGKDNQKSEKEQKTNEKAKEKHSLANQNPKRSRKVLRDALMREFSVGAGQKRGAMEIIDRAAAEIVKKGKLSPEGAEELFAGLVGRGVITERGDEYNRAVYDTLHSAKLRVTKNMISDIERIYGSVKNLRSKALGKIALTNDPNAAAENIDTYYEGLQQDFGRGMFPDAMHPADMMANILDAYERTAPKKKSLLDNIAEEAGDAGAFREMMNGFRETLDRALEQFGASAAIEMDTEQTYEKQMQAFREKRREQAARAKHAREFREEQNRLLSIAKQLKKLRPGQAGYDDVPEIVRQIDTVAKGISANGRIRLEGLSEQMQEFSELDENTVFSTHLMRQMDRLNNMHIAEMSEEDVRDLLDVCIEARHRIETQNKLIREKETQELHEAAGRALSAIGRAKDTWRRNRNGGSGGKRSMARAKNVFLEASNYEDENPLMQSFYDLENGQTKMIDYEYRAEKAVMDKLEEIFPSKRAMEKFLEETAGRNAAWADVDTGGQTLRLTAGMKMAIYLHSKNKANMKHMAGYVTEGEDGSCLLYTSLKTERMVTKWQIK